LECVTSCDYAVDVPCSHFIQWQCLHLGMSLFIYLYYSKTLPAAPCSPSAAPWSHLLYYKDVSKVENMRTMFHQASSFNNDISKWDTSSVTTIDHMFQSSSFNSDISKWSTSNVQRMESVFYNNHNFNQDLSSWGKFHLPFIAFSLICLLTTHYSLLLSLPLFVV
jgi:surface protein